MVGDAAPLPPEGATEAERSAALLFAHERLLTALLREIAQNDPGIAASVAARLAEDAAGARAGGIGEGKRYLVSVLEDYMRALGTRDL